MLDVRGFVCKVCDFGLSRSTEGTAEMYTSHPGTALFAAPELLSHGSVGFESDVYAYGILAWHLVSMGSTVGDLYDYQVRYQVCEKGWRPPFPAKTPEVLQQLVSRCWTENRDDRPSFTDLRGPLTDLLKAAQQEPCPSPQLQRRDDEAHAEPVARTV
jgi:serine/threonine protein kinase